MTSYDKYINTWIDILPNTKSNDIIIKLHYDYDLNSNFLQKAYNRLSQKIITHSKKLFPKRKPQRMMCGTPLFWEPLNSQSIILPTIRKQ